MILPIFGIIAPMDRLQAMTVFCRVARLESFAAAARALELSPTAVSRFVAGLEADLGVRLLNRTTRRQALTPEGAAYLDRAERILDEVRALDEAVTRREGPPRGQVRVTVGVSFAEAQLTPRVPGFLACYPELSLTLSLTDRKVDIVAEGFDVALRIGTLADSALTARPIATCRHAVCAAPGLVAERGRPEDWSGLLDWPTIVDTNQPRGWRFGPSGEAGFEPRGRYRVDSAQATREAALAGLGAAYLPTFVAGPAIADGRLEVLVSPEVCQPLPLVAVFPAGRFLSRAARAFVDFAIEAFSEAPWDTPEPAPAR